MSKPLSESDIDSLYSKISLYFYRKYGQEKFISFWAGFLSRNELTLKGMLFECVVPADEPPIAIPASILEKMREIAVQNLDGAKKPKSYTSPLPTIPMSLAEAEAEIKQNPAPLDANKGPSIISKMIYVADDYPRPLAYQEAQKILWALAAPEGMPPYPRRAGRYSSREDGMIRSWMEDVWPLWQEVKQLTRRKEMELGRQGIIASDLRIVLGVEYEQLNDFARAWGPRHYTGKYYPGAYPDAEGMTPEEWADGVKLWLQRAIMPQLEKIQSLEPWLFRKHTDPAIIDDQYRKLGFSHTKGLLRLYGVPEWSQPEDNKAFYPAFYHKTFDKVVRNHVYITPDLLHAGVPFSVVVSSELASKNEQDRARKDRFERLDQEKRSLFARIRASGKPVSKGSLEKMGYTVKIERSPDYVFISLPDVEGRIWLSRGTPTSAYAMLEREANG